MAGPVEHEALPRTACFQLFEMLKYRSFREVGADEFWISAQDLPNLLDIG